VDNCSVRLVKFKNRTKGTIPTLHEALKLCKELNLKVFLDVKALLYVAKVMANRNIFGFVTMQ